MTAATMNKYQACVYGLAKISETLDNAGFEKGATLALLALDSLVKDAQCMSDDGEKDDDSDDSDDGEKDDDKKDKKTTHKHETTKHTHEDDDDPECHVHEKGKTKNLSEKEEKEIGKKDKGKGKPPWLEDDEDDCGGSYPKGKTPDVANATGGGPGPTRSEMQGIVNPWEENGAGAAKTRPDDDWKQYDPLRGFDGELIEGLDADDGEEPERNKDTKKLLERIRGGKPNSDVGNVIPPPFKEKYKDIKDVEMEEDDDLVGKEIELEPKHERSTMEEPADEEFSFVSLLDDPGKDEESEFIDFRSIAARRRQRSTLSKVAEELRKTRPFFAR
jgi:hypothetical protein